MKRKFNVTGLCDPKRHYMIDITDRLRQIRELVDQGCYFTIEKPWQYGKTTTLIALADFLKDDYAVISLDFQMIGTGEFQDESAFSVALAEYILGIIEGDEHLAEALDLEVLNSLREESKDFGRFALMDIFFILSDLCAKAKKPIVLIVDEVDSSPCNQVFHGFLAQLRSYYLKRSKMPTFQSVILAGVADVKNRPIATPSGSEPGETIPWNIASDFLVDMSFNEADISGMLKEYEDDYHTGMDIALISKLIHDATSGYPYFVSRLCKMIDERLAGTEKFPSRADAWTKQGCLEAERMLVQSGDSPLGPGLSELLNHPELKKLLIAILFGGIECSYGFSNHAMGIAASYGLMENDHGRIVVSNRIYESMLYRMLMFEDSLENRVYASAAADKDLFCKCGHLGMRLMLERFPEAYASHTGSSEDDCRKLFMLFILPIITGKGYWHVNPETRNMKRLDIIVNVGDEEFVIMLKMPHGHEEPMDAEGLKAVFSDCYRLQKGYMVVFGFNKEKKIGVREVRHGERTLIEAIV